MPIDVERVMFIYFYHGEVLRVHNLSILVSPRNLVVYRRDNCISMGVGHRKSAQTQAASVSRGKSGDRGISPTRDYNPL